MYKESHPALIPISIFSIQGQRISINAQADTLIENLRDEAIKKFSGIKGSAFDNLAEYVLVLAISPTRQLAAKNTVKTENVQPSDILLLHKICSTVEPSKISFNKANGIPTKPGIEKATEGLPSKGMPKPRTVATQNSGGNLEQTFRKILLTLLDLSYKLMFFDDEADNIFKKKKPQIDPTLISSLTAMGFSEERACKALTASGLDLEAAMEWLLHSPEEAERMDVDARDTVEGNHGYSPVVHDDMSRIKQRFELWQEKNSSSQPKKEHVEVLIAMGFQESESLQALQYNGNNPNAACEWLLGDRKVPVGNPNECLSRDSELYKAITTDPAIHTGLHNKRVLEALEDMLDNPMRRHNWANDPTVGSVILQILKLYHKYSSSVS